MLFLPFFYLFVCLKYWFKQQQIFTSSNHCNATIYWKSILQKEMKKKRLVFIQILFLGDSISKSRSFVCRKCIIWGGAGGGNTLSQTKSKGKRMAKRVYYGKKKKKLLSLETQSKCYKSPTFDVVVLCHSIDQLNAVIQFLLEFTFHDCRRSSKILHKNHVHVI